MQFQNILQVILVITGIAILISLLVGFNFIRTGRKSPYFRIRQQRVGSGWQLIGLAFILSVFAAITIRFGNPFNERPLLTAPAVTLTEATFLTIVPTSAPVSGTIAPSQDAGITPVAINSATPAAAISAGPTAAQSQTLPPTSTPALTSTPRASATATFTPLFTSTLKPTLTPSLTNTHAPTLTPSMTLTAYPTWTQVFTPTLTAYPTWTQVNTPTLFIATHAPTLTVTPTRTPTPSRTPSNTSTIRP
jgi:hypothetical protein